MASKKLVFVAFKWFSYGGLTRDMEKIARQCIAKGYDVELFVYQIKGESPTDLNLQILSSARSALALSNHAKNKSFEAAVGEYKQNNPHAFIVGFNKMAHLDVYYAADSCFAAKPSLLKRPWMKNLPRYSGFIKQETSVFKQQSNTQVLMISKSEIDVYQAYYQTQSQRLHLLPPGIDQQFNHQLNRDAVRESYAKKLDTDLDCKHILFVGSGFKTKGLDRAINAISLLNQQSSEKFAIKLWVVGEDDSEPYQKQAQQLSIANHVNFLGARNDVLEMMVFADALIHPAYRENTGTVLLEASIAALPVVCSTECGYSLYIEQYRMGGVVGEPYTVDQFSNALNDVLQQPRDVWSARAGNMIEQEDLFHLHQYAAEFIIQQFDDSERANA